MLFASSEDSEEPEKIIPGKEMGDVKDRVAQESGENPEVEELLGEKDAQEDDGRISLDLPVLGLELVVVLFERAVPEQE